MNRCKLIFNQTLMISTAIWFGLGIQQLIEYLSGTDAMMICPWYMPLSVIFTGFLCALATLLLVDGDNSVRTVNMKVRIALHFIALFAVVSLCGFIFGWYSSLGQFIPVAVIYVLTYVFVWISTMWIYKADEKKINEAITDIRDEE